MANEEKKSLEYYDLLGEELDEKADEEERKIRASRRHPEFRNGQFVVSGQPVIDNFDDEAD